MKMDVVAGSHNDEFYTPDYAVFPIIKYLKEGTTIWCPFDTEESFFVRILKEKGFQVIATHKNTGKDFFDYSLDDIPYCDYIVSNPPYSLKTEVFNRLFLLGKSFAMLVGVVGLFESQERFRIFERNEFEIMYFNKRISFFKSFGEQKPSLNPPFSSVYVCKGILPKQIVFERIKPKPEGRGT